jgi:hypothetical protein
MRISIFAALAASAAPTLFAQLTPEQRVQDFQSLAALYAKRYAPLEWKKRAVGVDVLDVKPWIERVRLAKDDIDYHEIAAEYVATFADSHTRYQAPGAFTAFLGFSVDIYEGVVLIEQIDRLLLPQADYPFQVGDELISVDGRSSEEWITELSKRRRWGNPEATRRSAADRITFRPQSTEPRAGQLGDTATVVIRRQSGDTNTYAIKWQKINLPFRGSPAVPAPKVAAARSAASARSDYMSVIADMWNWSVSADDPFFMGETHDEDGNAVPRKYLLGFGSRSPVFLPFPGFVQRLGRNPVDFHFSGTYEADGQRIGYLRIPNFAPLNTAAAIRELETEIQYFEANTDGLVVDVTRNTGGGCYMLEAAKRLINYDFWFFGEEIRPTWDRITSLQFALEAARMLEAEQWVIEVLTFQVDRLSDAYRTGANLSVPLPACSAMGGIGAAVWENSPAAITYSKPMIVLIDEFSTSAGDIFPAMIQDNKRALLVGKRTNGAGGSISGWPSGVYTEGLATNTNSLVVRRDNVPNAPDMPVARYIENTGVRPDVEVEIMTKANLMNRGRTYVDDFTRIMVDHIRGLR